VTACRQAVKFLAPLRSTDKVSYARKEAPASRRSSQMPLPRLRLAMFRRLATLPALREKSISP
jgi:hypothetical protein